MEILILGSHGMLGTSLMHVFPRAVGWSKSDGDVTNFSSLSHKIKSLVPIPDVIINCVAYNDVDGAEVLKEQAHQLNAELPGNLALLCKEMGATLVHLSTNYVFDGSEGTYLESAKPAPLSAYGSSKYAGEIAIAKNAEQYYIIRTSVLFGPPGSSEHSKKSFVQTMLDLSEKNATIKAVTDEVNNVTYVNDLALAIKSILENKESYGIYHITNSGMASWYDFAKEIFRITKKNIDLVPVPAHEFLRKAKRPHKSVLLNIKIPPLRSWEEALMDFLNVSTNKF